MKTSKVLATLPVVLAAAMWTVGVINLAKGNVPDGIGDLLMAVSCVLMALAVRRQMKAERMLALTAKQLAKLLETLHKGVPATLTITRKDDNETIPEDQLTDDEKRVKRMAEEYDQLAGRLERLTKFIKSDKFGTLSAESQKLLFAQYDAMGDYEKALKERIELECDEANKPSE